MVGGGSNCILIQEPRNWMVSISSITTNMQASPRLGSGPKVGMVMMVASGLIYCTQRIGKDHKPKAICRLHGMLHKTSCCESLTEGQRQDSGAVMFHPQMIRPWLVQPVLYIPRIFYPPFLLSHGAYIPWMVHPTGFLDPAPWTLWPFMDDSWEMDVMSHHFQGCIVHLFC
jgi:hypothetical protein